MIQAFQAIRRLLFVVAIFSTAASGNMLIHLYEHHQDKLFQLVGSGQVNFSGGTYTNLVITPVNDGELISPPECEDGQRFAWNANSYPLPPAGSDPKESFPELRLCRSGQPVMDLFF